MLRDRSLWLALLFLLIGVLMPVGCVLYFMNEAARSQAEAARQSVRAAWRGRLIQLRGQLETFWWAKAVELNGDSASDFARIVANQTASSAVVLSASGAVIYPIAMPSPGPDLDAQHSEWQHAQDLERQPGQLIRAASAYGQIARTNARAAQGEIRCLLQAGDKSGALAAIHRFMSSPAARGVDLQHRLVAADELLLAVHLKDPGAASKLSAMLSDYRDVAMQSAQRLFLMNELRSLHPELPDFPTRRAEELAASFLAHRGSVPAGFWQLTSANSRVIGLYPDADVVARSMRILAREDSAGVSFWMRPADAKPTATQIESMDAGRWLPGWKVGFDLRNARLFEEAAQKRRASYLWVGYLVAAAMVLTGLLVGQALRRQAKLSRLKTDLVAAVSHELKTPLSSMRLLVDSLLDDRTFETAKTRDYLELISGENARLTRLIENFLTFSRIERNRQSLDFAPVAPAQIIEASTEAMRGRLEGCRVSVDVAPDLPEVRADRDALVTVMLNLLDNAWKYSSGEKEIAIRCSEVSGHVAIEVQDNGIGIHPREHRRIFRRFYQVDRRLTRQTGGCGLGLSIVDSIVRAHGGSVTVVSRPGEGSTFRVLLPEWSA